MSNNHWIDRLTSFPFNVIPTVLVGSFSFERPRIAKHMYLINCLVIFFIVAWISFCDAIHGERSRIGRSGLSLSYRRHKLCHWFLGRVGLLIQPVVSHVTYMTAIGNHEKDYINSGSVYITPDSGGECGVAYEAYFPMPTSAKDKPWYSINQAGIHLTVISTEHPWTENSEQVDLC